MTVLLWCAFFIVIWFVFHCHAVEMIYWWLSGQSGTKTRHQITVPKCSDSSAPAPNCTDTSAPFVLDTSSPLAYTRSDFEERYTNFALRNAFLWQQCSKNGDTWRIVCNICTCTQIWTILSVLTKNKPNPNPITSLKFLELIGKVYSQATRWRKYRLQKYKLWLRIPSFILKLKLACFVVLAYLTTFAVNKFDRIDRCRNRTNFWKGRQTYF